MKRAALTLGLVLSNAHAGLAAELTRDDRKVIEAYVDGTHRCLNAYLREGPSAIPETCFHTTDEEQIRGEVAALGSALSKLPARKGVTYRGICVSSGAMTELQLNGYYQDPAFISGSGSRDAALDAPMPPSGCARTVFEIQGESGRDLSGFSGEDEALFPNSTHFQVTAIKQATSETTHPNGDVERETIYFVGLKE